MTIPGDTGSGTTSPSQADVGTAVSSTGVTFQSHPPDPGSLPPEEDLSGQVFAERYQIQRKIGSGGMGQVYLGEHVTINKPVAIKVLSSAYRTRHDIVTRFLGEARAASALRHEHVVDITDFGTTPEGVVYFVMEYLEGQPLDDLLKTEGPLDWTRARDFMQQVLDALEAAHEKGIVHRDMKPDNCFVVPRSGGREHVKVLDFGIAKVTTSEGTEGLTETGAIMGTANYMSPEQAQGERLDRRTDIYSCGVMLYEMLAGRRPFEANNPMSVMYKHLHAEVPPLLDVFPGCKVPGEAEQVLGKALAKDREARYASAAEFARALREVPDRSAVRLSSAPLTGEDREAPAPRRARASLPLYVGLGVALVALAGVGVWLATRGTGDAGEALPASAEGAVAAAPVPDAKTEENLEPPPVRGDDETSVAPEPGSATAEAGTEGPSGANPDGATGDASADDAGSDAAGGSEGPGKAEDADGPSGSSATATGKTARSKPGRDGGARTPRSVSRALRKQTGSKVDNCLKQGGAFPGESIPARVSVDASGKVTGVKLGRKYASTPMGRCVIRAIEGAKLPAGDGTVQVDAKYSL